MDGAIMALETVVAAAVPAVNPEAWEIRLVKETSSRLASEFPQKPKHRIISELLAGLLEEKQSRQARNLNHWPEYGPKFLLRLAAQWQEEETRRLDRVAVFLKARRKDAVRLALAITDNRADAEAAVSDADLDLLSGAVKEKFYLLAAKRNALDLVRRRKFEAEMFVPLEQAFGPGDDQSDDPAEGMGGSDCLGGEPPAADCDSLDPLDILVQREERKEFVSLVKKAFKDRRWRFCKRKKWARPLLVHVPKCAARPITE
jgi:hypothetical protein